MIDADHENMCKFKSKTDEGYEMVLGDVDDLVDEAKQKIQEQQG